MANFTLKIYKITGSDTTWTAEAIGQDGRVKYRISTGDSFASDVSAVNDLKARLGIRMNKTNGKILLDTSTIIVP